MTTHSRFQLWNACLGNLFEHYEAALFGFLSPFLAPLMFPNQDPITALVLTYAMIPLSMIARPIGSLVFGYIGDVYGRGYTLFLTLVGMAIVSAGIALCPTYAQVGTLAPVILCIAKALQNFFAAGESMGGAIFLLENAPQKKHDFLSSVYNASTMAGILLASFAVYLIGKNNFIDLGWRLLYLCGCVTIVFGCFLRRSSPVIQKSVKFSETFSKLKNTLWLHKKALLFIAVISGFGSACYSMALVLMNGFIPLITDITKAEIMKINTYLLVFDFCAIPFFGWVASKVSRNKLMLYASLCVVVLSVPLISLLEGASLAGIISIRILLVLFGVAFFAPFHAWAGQQVPQEARYAVISLGYALGSQLLGGPTSAFSLWCFQTTGLVSSVAWYWMFLASLSSGIMILAIRDEKIKVLQKV